MATRCGRDVRAPSGALESSLPNQLCRAALTPKRSGRPIPTPVIERACPLFVPLAEEGWADQDVARTVAETYLKDLRSSIDTLVLGCTHYPILRDVIQATVGAQVELIDSGEATAREVKSLLAEKGLARAPSGTGALERHLCDDLDHFYVTDAAERFASVAERFLGSKPARLEAVEVWGHDELRSGTKERPHPAGGSQASSLP